MISKEELETFIKTSEKINKELEALELIKPLLVDSCSELYFNKRNITMSMPLRLNIKDPRYLTIREWIQNNIDSRVK